MTSPQLTNSLHTWREESRWLRVKALIGLLCLLAAVPLGVSMFISSYKTAMDHLGGQGLGSLHSAVAAGNLDIARVVANPSNINAYDTRGLTPLVVAANANKIEMIQFLLDRGAEIDKTTNQGNGSTALFIAVLSNRAEATKLLLDHGADVNHLAKNKYTALHIAASNNNEAILNLLVAHGANLNALADDGATPLKIAIKNKHARAIEILKKAGATQ